MKMAQKKGNILLTGMCGIADVERGFRAKADAYMVKPFLPVVLIDKIGELIEEKQEKRKRLSGSIGVEKRPNKAEILPSKTPDLTI